MGWNDVALWKTFAKYGRISDVYIAKKKTLTGKTFGFARFTDVQNPKTFESTLNSITVGTQRISVNIARYQNGRNNSTRQQPHNLTHHHQPKNTSEPRHLANIPIDKSYAHILNTKTPSKTSQPPKPITIHSCPDLTTSLEHSLVGELFTIETLPNLHTICTENGLPDIRVKYLGGFSVLIILNQHITADTFLSNTSIVNCFKTLNLWNNKFYLKDRLTWLAIEGLPPQAWHEAAFTRIAKDWGEIVFPEKCDDSNNNLVTGRVCIRTSHMDFIQHTLPVIVDGVNVCVRVREIPDECDEFIPPVKPVSTEEDDENDEVATNQRDDEDDEEDLYDDDSDSGITYKSSDDAVVEKVRRDLNLQASPQSQTSNNAESQIRNVIHEISSSFVLDSQINETTTLGTTLAEDSVERGASPVHQTDGVHPREGKRYVSSTNCNMEDPTNSSHKRSLNINGVGTAPKKKLVRKFCKDNNLNFIGIQESKSILDDASFIHSLWGNNNCDFALKKSNGSSGGIIALWDDSLFQKHKVINNEEGFIAVYGEWIKTGIACLMIVVYAPQDFTKKCTLWNRLHNLVISFNNMSIILGDFNEVRFDTERMGSLFCKYGAKRFNEFINNTELVDLPMGGRKFTRMDKYGTKLSKLDRILVSRHFLSKWPNAQLLALPRDLSDHCPIVLKTHSGDYGAIPFKFFNSWLLNGDFPTLLSQAWPKTTHTATQQNIQHPAIILKSKFQCLKKAIRAWRKDVVFKNDSLVRELKDKVDFLELKAENGGGIGNELNNNRGLPSSTWKSIGDLNNHLASVDINLHSTFVRKVGDGYSFDFWNEHWIGDCNLQTTYPRLYMLENDKHCKIYERVTIVDGVQTLNWNWRRPIRDGPESEQLSGLLIQLRDLNLSNTPDTWNYTLDPSLLFSVSSFRRHVESCCFDDNPRIPDNTVLFETECQLDRISMGIIVESYLSTDIPKIKPKNDYGLHYSSNYIVRAQGLAMKKDRTHLWYTMMGYRIEERKDGWMEAMLFKPTIKLQDQKNGCILRIYLKLLKDEVNGMIIEGFEFRPYI
ncbi:RNA-directed DNA polymerase, eukaryota [Artemisia annua]|uniref:RNA-directed DNA polymerase, eukaryota n=1 Tax=Artemisia annua TaxID=35608 RepID=A0A2U1P6G6_ARTAN|nr:RNA-directed DNA polymerase, eukaryota [Artemisia annua]